MDIINLRRDYKYSRLRRKDLSNDPLDLFHSWLYEACNTNLIDPTAMCLSTVDFNGQPYQRIVLLKHYDTNGLVFYTNWITSRKSNHINYNNNVSLLFFWQQLERQVCFLGKAKKLLYSEVKRYFYSRPRNSQITSCISKQSMKLKNSIFLEEQFNIFKKEYENIVIPVPKHWGGYRVIFNSVEFWQGGLNRLHDRFLYQKKNNKWEIDRLAP